MYGYDNKEECRLRGRLLCYALALRRPLVGRGMEKVSAKKFGQTTRRSTKLNKTGT